jgi:hypothetical protein
MECDYCEQQLSIKFCKRCDGYFWEGHTATCAVPAMFPALEQHFQKCVQHGGFDPDEIIC